MLAWRSSARKPQAMNEPTTKEHTSPQKPLGRLQRHLLVVLLRNARYHEEWEDARPSLLPDVRIARTFGTPWCPEKWWPDMSRAEVANVARALARLEARGLLIRQHLTSSAPDSAPHSAPHSAQAHIDPHSLPPRHCEHVLLLPAGRSIAKHLEETERG